MRALLVAWPSLHNPKAKIRPEPILGSGTNQEDPYAF